MIVAGAGSGAEVEAVGAEESAAAVVEAAAAEMIADDEKSLEIMSDRAVIWACCSLIAVFMSSMSELRAMSVGERVIGGGLRPMSRATGTVGGSLAETSVKSMARRVDPGETPLRDSSRSSISSGDVDIVRRESCVIVVELYQFQCSAHFRMCENKQCVYYTVPRMCALAISA